MAQPTPYERSYSFTSYQQSNPNSPLPGNRVDIEYNNVKVTLDDILANLALIQRDDGVLANGVVTQASLADDLSIGFTFRGTWAEGVDYLTADGVALNGKFYVCLADHTSSVSNTPELDSTKWDLAVDFTEIALNASGSMVPFALSGDGSTTVFSLPASVSNANNLIVTVSGVLQRATADYTASGTTLTFTSAPPAGTNNIFGQIFNVISVSGSLPASSVLVSPAVSGGSDAQTVLTTHAALITSAASAASTAQTTAYTAVSSAATALSAANDAQADADAAYLAATAGNVAGTRITTGTLPFTAVGSASIATQSDAEAGASSTKFMTPERTAQAIAVLASAGATAGRLLGVTQFTSSGTWTKATFNPGFVIVEVIGGGGGGGGLAATSPIASAGGGGGGYSRKRIVAASLGATETVTIGAGGTAGANTGGNGGTGGTTSFGAHATATGGTGGDGAAGTGAGIRAGGAGGTGSSGDYNQSGEPGGLGIQFYASGVSGGSASASLLIAGNGGGTVVAGGPRGPVAVASAATNASNNSGAGGTGAVNTTTVARVGGVGGTGYVLVWEYA